MSKENYSNIRNVMHTYSRAPLAEGQQHIDQSTIRAGHNISVDDIRGEKIPKIYSIGDRDEHYLVEDNGKRVIGGVLGASYVNVLKFIEKGKLQEIPNTNGEAYIIVDDNNNPIVNWIDPSDQPINQYILSDGYEIRLFAQNGTEIYRDYGWEFDTFNGILHFKSEFTPHSSDWNFGTPTIQGIVYIGKKASELTASLDQTLASFKNTIDNEFAKAIAIQPFKFTTDQMMMIGQPYQKGDEFMQRLTFIVPGYCFEISYFKNTTFTKTETFVTEMSHLPDGCTQIFVDIPWYVDNDKPLLGYEYREENGMSIKQPVIGAIGFIAATFVSQDGKRVPVKPLIDYSAESIDYIIPIPEDDAHEFVVPDATSNNTNGFNVNVNDGTSISF